MLVGCSGDIYIYIYGPLPCSSQVLHVVSRGGFSGVRCVRCPFRDEVAALVRELPTENYILSARLYTLLGRVAENADKNLMNVNNLAIVVGPNVRARPPARPPDRRGAPPGRFVGPPFPCSHSACAPRCLHHAGDASTPRRARRSPDRGCRGSQHAGQTPRPALPHALPTRHRAPLAPLFLAPKRTAYPHSTPRPLAASIRIATQSATRGQHGACLHNMGGGRCSRDCPIYLQLHGGPLAMPPL